MPTIAASYWTNPSGTTRAVSTKTPSPSSFDAERALQLARDTFDIEARALLGLKTRLGPEFAAAVKAVLACQGRVVVMGMGKSGHVGRKVAATLAKPGAASGEYFFRSAKYCVTALRVIEYG